jgi:hypothetical protein
MKDGKEMQEALKMNVIICNFLKKEAPILFKMRFSINHDKSAEKK